MFGQTDDQENNSGPNYRLIIVSTVILVVIVSLIFGALAFFGVVSWNKKSSSALSGELGEKQPKTKIEEFQAKTGAVIVKGYTTIGAISDAGNVEVTAMEFTEAATGSKSTGVSIEVRENGTLEKRQSSFIDYDEIDSLISGIDYVSRANASVTKHKQFESTYVTKGCFKVTVFNSDDNSLRAAISGGCVVPTQVFMAANKLANLRNLLVEAKRSLDTAGR